jgi:uncharacterized damage-inducible protein DinB
MILTIDVLSATGNDRTTRVIVGRSGDDADHETRDTMRETTAWFDRTFDVPYPADLLPPLLARLRGTPARLEELMRGSSPERLRARPDGKWSAQENAGHLCDLEALWLARVDDYLRHRRALTPADLTNQGTRDANHNAADLEQLLRAFRSARAALLAAVESVEPAQLAHALLHPRLRIPMTLADHLYFVAEHDDHHLARIWQLIDVDR